MLATGMQSREVRMRVGIFSWASVAPVLTETTIFEAYEYPGHFSDVVSTEVSGGKVV